MPKDIKALPIKTLPQSELDSRNPRGVRPVTRPITKPSFSGKELIMRTQQGAATGPTVNPIYKTY